MVEMVIVNDSEFNIYNKPNQLVLLTRTEFKEYDERIIDFLCYSIQTGLGQLEDPMNINKIPPYFVVDYGKFINSISDEKIEKHNIRKTLKRMTSMSVETRDKNWRGFVVLFPEAFIDNKSNVVRFKVSDILVDAIVTNNSNLEYSETLKKNRIESLNMQNVKFSQKLNYLGLSDYTYGKKYELSKNENGLYCLLLKDIYKFKNAKYIDYKLEDFALICGVKNKRHGELKARLDALFRDVRLLTKIKIKCEFIIDGYTRYNRSTHIRVWFDYNNSIENSDVNYILNGRNN